MMEVQSELSDSSQSNHPSLAALSEQQKKIHAYNQRLAALREDYQKWMVIFRSTFRSDEDCQNELKRQDDEEARLRAAEDAVSESERASESEDDKRSRGGRRKPKRARSPDRDTDSTPRPPAKISNLDGLVTKVFNRGGSFSIDEIATKVQKGARDYSVSQVKDALKSYLANSLKYQQDGRNYSLIKEEDDEEVSSATRGSRPRRDNTTRTSKRSKSDSRNTRTSSRQSESSGSGGCRKCGKGYRAQTEWIMCDKCEEWWCLDCAGIDDLSLYDDANPSKLEFRCENCVPPQPNNNNTEGTSAMEGVEITVPKKEEKSAEKKPPVKEEEEEEEDDEEEEEEEEEKEVVVETPTGRGSKPRAVAASTRGGRRAAVSKRAPVDETEESDSADDSDAESSDE